ncbi:hypothetical protein CGRA01v4_11439 [Colletotrichum graminicola]|nr:hypothetical protein CGRA01v4_11439 [Colletotrichum graminicola]
MFRNTNELPSSQELLRPVPVHPASKCAHRVPAPASVRSAATATATATPSSPTLASTPSVGISMDLRCIALHCTALQPYFRCSRRQASCGTWTHRANTRPPHLPSLLSRNMHHLLRRNLFLPPLLQLSRLHIASTQLHGYPHATSPTAHTISQPLFHLGPPLGTLVARPLRLLAALGRPYHPPSYHD